MDRAVLAGETLDHTTPALQGRERTVEEHERGVPARRVDDMQLRVGDVTETYLDGGAQALLSLIEEGK